MGIFNMSSRYSKEGPGIDKNAPKKKGISLFFEILFREIWSLFKLNLIFVMFCIPVVTIFPAIGAMTYVTIRMVRDEPNEPWLDFIDGFKKNWKQSTILGIIIFVIYCSAGSSFLIGLSNDKFYFFLLAFLMNLIGTIFAIYAFPMIVSVDLPLYPALKNAAILGISCLNYSLAAFFAIEAILIAVVVFFPLSFPVIVVVAFSLISFISSFAGWAAIKKYVVKGDPSVKPPAESRCGLLCTKCEYVEEFGCRGCMNIESPFWSIEGGCPVKNCCEDKAVEHCGLCEEFPCELLEKFAYDPEQGDKGERIEQCRKWAE